MTELMKFLAIISLSKQLQYGSSLPKSVFLTENKYTKEKGCQEKQFQSFNNQSTIVWDEKSVSSADQPEEGKCKVVDSSVLATKARQRSGARQLIDTSGPRLVSRHPSPRQLFPVAVYTHLMPRLPSLQSSLHHSSMGPLGRHAYQCFMRDGGEGTRDWERYRARESMEGGLGSAVRPRQQSESIKSVGLLLHWVVINRSWTLSPARRADRVNEGPKAAPHPPPSSHPNSLFPLPPLSLPPLSHLPSFGWSSIRKGKEAKMPVLLLVKRAKTRSWSSGFEQSQRSVAYSAERNI